MTYVKVQVPVKPYTGAFLEREYGNPVQLHGGDNIGKYFYRLLDNPSSHRNSRITLSRYTYFVTISITQTVFLQHGHILTPTDIVNFNNFLEDHIEKAFEFFVCGAVIVGKKKRADAYRAFQEVIAMSECNLPYETLKKKADRSGFLKNTTQRP